MYKIKREDFITTNWSGGTTSEIFISPKNSDVSKRNFDYRISSATCDLEESVFSDYTGYNRFLTPLDGDLKIVDEGKEVIIKPYEIFEFSGENSVTGYSKIRDYNLIIKNNLNGKMYSVTVNGEESLLNNSEKMVIFNFDKDLKINSENFEKFSALVLEKNESVKIFGEGNILICEIN